MKYYAFLKGINVGGKIKVGMAELIHILQESYEINAKSYINSGNLIIESSGNRNFIKETIVKVIDELYALHIETIIITKTELEKIYKADPFTGSEYEKAKSIVYFANKKPDAEKVTHIKDGKGITEKYAYSDGILYVYYENGLGRSKFTT